MQPSGLFEDCARERNAAESLREKHVYPYRNAPSTGFRLAMLID